MHLPQYMQTLLLMSSVCFFGQATVRHGLTVDVLSDVAEAPVFDMSGLMQSGGGPSGTAPEGGPATKGGMASLMRRAVQQARAEAAAAKVQAPASQVQDATGKAQFSNLEQVPNPAGGDKRALASVLKKAAQKMQQQKAATESDKVASAFASLAVSQQGLGSRQGSVLGDNGFIEAEQLHAGTTEGAATPDEAQLSAARSRASSSNSAEILLSELPPERNQSLGERLGAMLRGALSLSRQSSYVPVAADDDDADGSAAAASTSQLSPVGRRALPRDASYLPEWLNRTLSSSSGNVHQDDGLETQIFLQEQAEDASELPQWVDWSTMQLEADAAPVKWRPAPLSLPAEETPSTQPMLDAEPTTAQNIPTPKGHRLFEFWQQKSAGVATGPLEIQALKPFLPHAHDGRRQASSQKRTWPFLASRPAQLQSDVSFADGAAADLSLQQVAEGLQAQGAPPTHTEIAAELEATSRLVQQQSARQAELLEGLQHALSQISQHCLLIQNPTAQLEASVEDVSEAQTGNVSAKLRDCCAQRKLAHMSVSAIAGISACQLGVKGFNPYTDLCQSWQNSSVYGLSGCKTGLVRRC